MKIANIKNYLKLLVLVVLLASLIPFGAGVQAVGGIVYEGEIGSISNNSSGTTLVIPVDVGVSVGNTVIVAYAGRGSPSYANPLGVIDSKGNTYNQAEYSICYQKGRTYLLYAHVTTALLSGDTINITTPNVGGRAAVACAFSGLAEVDVVDQTAKNPTGTNNQAQDDEPSVGPVTTTQADELIIGVIGTEEAVTASAGNWEHGFTTGPREGTDGAIYEWTVSLGYQIVSTTGTYTAEKTGLDTPPDPYYAAVIATFKGAVPDVTDPTVTIDQAATQSDPTSATTINFDVVFSELVADFATGDVTLGGTAGATTADVTGSGTTYNIAVSGMMGSGTVTASIAAGVAHDGAGNPNEASTSSDNEVTYDPTLLLYRVNCGGPTLDMVPDPDFAALEYSDLTTISGLTVSGVTTSISTSNDVDLSGVDPTLPKALFQTGLARIGAGSMDFDFTVPNGDYNVHLHFNEHNATYAEPGMRVFDVFIEGVEVLPDYEIGPAAGGANIAVTEIESTTVSDGVLNLSIVQQESVPGIRGIEIVPATASGSVVSSAVPSDDSPSVGQQITVDIIMDVTDVSLGSFSGTLDWDPAVLAYDSYIQLAGYTGVVNTAGVGTGHLVFNGANPTGPTGSFTVLTVTFDVLDSGVSDLDLEYSAMAAAGSFADLLPVLTINDGLVPVNTWFLTNPEMYLGDTSKPVGAVEVAEGSPVVWLSNQSTPGGYTFESGTWSGQITLTAGLADGNQFTVLIGSSPSIDPEAFDEAGSQLITAGAGQSVFPVSIGTVVEVPVGEYLALKIVHGGGYGPFNVRVGEAYSYISAPDTQPMYPLPEIAAGLLFALGVIALGIVIWYRKRQKVTVQNPKE